MAKQIRGAKLINNWRGGYRKASYAIKDRPAFEETTCCKGVGWSSQKGERKVGSAGLEQYLEE